MSLVDSVWPEFSIACMTSRMRELDFVEFQKKMWKKLTKLLTRRSRKFVTEAVQLIPISQDANIPYTVVKSQNEHTAPSKCAAILPSATRSIVGRELFHLISAGNLSVRNGAAAGAVNYSKKQRKYMMRVLFDPRAERVCLFTALSAARRGR